MLPEQNLCPHGSHNPVLMHPWLWLSAFGLVLKSHPSWYWLDLTATEDVIIDVA